MIKTQRSRTSNSMLLMPRKLFSTADKIDSSMKQFAEKTLEMDYHIVEQGLNRGNNMYQASLQRPNAAPFMTPCFDFSQEALMQRGQRLGYYLMFASFYGAYYFTAISPHSMYMMGTSFMSLVFSVGFINYQMTIELSVADI